MESPPSGRPTSPPPDEVVFAAMDARGERVERDLESNLDPADRAWRERRFAGGPLVFGVLSFATAPFLIGLLLGSAGLRSGIDLWRSGTRRGIVVAGILANVLGLVVSILAALAWGALLASVLLGRDAIRESERWRGSPVDLAAIAGPDGPVLAPSAGRTALLLVDPAVPICLDAVTALVEADRRAAGCRIVVVTRSDDRKAPRPELDLPAGWILLGPGTTLPAPLDDVAVLPTFVIVGPAGRIEKALVGVHPPEELVRVLDGSAAEPRPAEVRPREGERR